MFKFRFASGAKYWKERDAAEKGSSLEHRPCPQTLRQSLFPSQEMNEFIALIRIGGRSGKGNQNMVE